MLLEATSFARLGRYVPFFLWSLRCELLDFIAQCVGGSNAQFPFDEASHFCLFKKWLAIFLALRESLGYCLEAQLLECLDFVRDLGLVSKNEGVELVKGDLRGAVGGIHGTAFV